MTSALRQEQPLIIQLNEEDDIVSIRDRLDWARAVRVALVLPPRGKLLREEMDLILLRRYADSLRLQVGLVTADGRVRARARTFGIPTFLSAQAAEVSRRGWWRARLRPGRSQRRLVMDAADRQEVKRRRAARPRWRQWALRYLAIVVYIFTVTALFVAAAYLIPGASVRLQPEVQPLRVTLALVADPTIEESESAGMAPGRTLSSVQQWQASVATTGSIEVPAAPSRGRVVFVNQSAEPVIAPAGTRVGTSAGVRLLYQTTRPVEVPGVVGGTAEAEVVAVEPGEQGNVDAYQINRVEGPLGIQLRVRNLEPTSGGGARLEKAVTEADVERLRAQVLQQIQTLALAEMQTLLGPDEFLAEESLRLGATLHETYSHFPGEQSERLALDLRLELRATAVGRSGATDLIYEELAAAVGPGYELTPSTLRFEIGSVREVDAAGRVHFEMVGEALMAAKLDLTAALPAITGQEIDQAQAFLFETLPLSAAPDIDVSPEWFDRVPYLTARLRPEIETALQ
ncbi:MAG: baseplate J/gp47 family protein [Candidatus Promineifilaceae bacterium]